ncbi:PREDICTED: uncharacterized protein LOC109339630 [Lupinus angustifolius]|uniref:uncharacterized protein LOC109339630 n=1 Tax=Lupinus angustifolius TaxID=3871 RepID=UPI00092E367C|nr:PREDICTED: uncharacterized protein LOC109339630 [Lupinus angustifolius]
MKVLFNFQEVSDAVEDGLLVPGPEITEIQRTMFKEAKKKDNKALFLLYQYVDDIHIEKIQNATTANEKGKKNHNEKEAYTTQEELKEEPLTHMVTNSVEHSYESWYLDSGCSNHMTSHKELLADFDLSRKNNVKFVDDSTLNVDGTSDVVILRNNGSNALIFDVLFIPGLKCNLLSIGQLVQKGFTSIMKDGQCELFDVEKRLILRSILTKSRTFEVNITTAKVQCFAAMESIEESWSWYCRYGHLNFKSLHQLGLANMVLGIPISTLPKKMCEVCLAGKQSRRSFKSHLSMRARGILLPLLMKSVG